MHPSRRAEALLNQHGTPADREAAMIFAMLAVAQAIENLGDNIEEATKGIALELGAISMAVREQ